MAMTDMFLKIDTIKGESTDAKHVDEIEVESFSFGVEQHGMSFTGGGSGAGKAHFKDISFVKRADNASPALMLACASGHHLPFAILTVRKAGGKQEEYYKIKMYDLIVSNFENSGSGVDQIPVEHLSLNFSKIEFKYQPQKKDGSLGSVSAAGWDLKTNQKV